MLKTTVTTTINGSCVIQSEKDGKRTELQAANMYGTSWFFF